MIIYPVSLSTKLSCKNSKIQSFRGHISQKEIQEVGDHFIKESKLAKNREEFYSVAKSYLNEGIIPVLDRNNKLSKDSNNEELRREIVNMIFSDIELSFAPSLMKLQENVKHAGLKEERKHFINIVKTVNEIIESWHNSKNKTKSMKH